MGLLFDLVDGVFSLYDNKPIEFCQDILNVKLLSKDQKRALEAFTKYKRIAVPAGHSTGKTGLEALLTLYWMATKIKPRVIVTAPTYRQLQYVYYAEVFKWYNKSDLKAFDMFCIKNNIMHLNDEDYKKEWYMLPISPKSPDALQGQHGDKSKLVEDAMKELGIELVESDDELRQVVELLRRENTGKKDGDNLLIIIEEASGVDSAILEVLEGTDYSKIAMFGNMTKNTGMFYDAVYKQSGFNIVRMSSYDSPFMSYEQIAHMEDTYGKESNIVKVRLCGEAPDSENDTIIPRKLAESCINLVVDESKIPDEFIVRGNDIWVSIDVARFGDDNTQTYVREKYDIIDEYSVSKKDTMNTVGRICNISKDHVDRYLNIIIDGVGVGGGVVDRLNEIQRYDEDLLQNANIIEIHNNGKALLETEYVNFITEGFFEIKMRMEAGALSLPDDSELIEDLCGRKFGFDSKGRLVIESKDEFKKRFKRSPDKGDAFIMLWKKCSSFRVID